MQCDENGLYMRVPKKKRGIIDCSGEKMEILFAKKKGKWKLCFML